MNCHNKSDDTFNVKLFLLTSCFPVSLPPTHPHPSHITHSYDRDGIETNNKTDDGSCQKERPVLVFSLEFLLFARGSPQVEAAVLGDNLML